jgi:arylsulfatase A-like enzyme
MKQTAILILTLLTFLRSAYLGAEEAPKLSKPNIIIILSDDQGYGDLSCYDHDKEVSTPNIDSLAKSGIRLTNGYTSAAVCAPTRAGLLAGRYQQRFGVYGNKDILGTSFLTQITLPDVLKKHGYVTGAIGKWHLGRDSKEQWPNQRGFDEFYGFLMSARGYYGELPNNPIMRNGEKIPAGEDYLTDAFTREAVSFIDRHSNRQPFFLYLPYNTPHYPLMAREEHLKRFNTGDKSRDTYLAMLASLDEGVGKIIDALRKNGVHDDTLLIFLSDNGGDIGYGGRNGKLRADKGQLYEGGIRVPFIVSWPRRMKGGGVCDVPMMSIDIFPTAVAAAGGTMPDDRAYDGRDMLPILTGEAQGPLHDALFWEAESRGKKPAPWAVRQGDWKLISGKELELYNLASDMGETKNLIAEESEIASRLNALHQQWKASVEKEATTLPQ